MAKKVRDHTSSRFSRQKTKGTYRKIFADGHWSTIHANLELSGWSPAQIKLIRDLMNRGWPLVESAKQVSTHLGVCPIKTKLFK